MNEEVTAAEKAANFAEMWSNKPWMIMGNASSLLESARAFLFGVKWAAAFQEPDLESFRRFLESFDRTLTRHLSGSDDGVSWFDALQARHNGDQSKAFREFTQLFWEIAKQEGFISSDTIKSVELNS